MLLVGCHISESRSWPLTLDRASSIAGVGWVMATQEEYEGKRCWRPMLQRNPIVSVLADDPTGVEFHTEARSLLLFYMNKSLWLRGSV